MTSWGNTNARRRAAKATAAGIVLVAVLAASAYALGAVLSDARRGASRSDRGLVIHADPARRAVVPGSTVTYLVHVTRGPQLVLPRGPQQARITARVFLRLAGRLPRGVTATLAPRSTRGALATVTVRAAASAPAGTYHLRLSGQGRLRNDARHPLRHARTGLTLIVASPLRIRAQPASRTIAPGATAVFDLRPSRRGRLIRQRSSTRARLAARVGVHLAQPLPRGISATIAPHASRGGRMRLALSTAASLPLGAYRVRLDAHGRLNRDPVRRVSTTVTLVVASPVTPPVSAPVTPPERATFSISGRTTRMLSPGVSAPLDLSLTNDHGSALTVGQLVVRVAAVLAPAADAAHPCTLADFAVTQFGGAYGFLVRASTTSTLSALGIPAALFPRVAMINRPLNQDGCKHATLTLAYSGIGWGTAP